MSHFYAMPTYNKARVNPNKPETAEFYEPDRESLIVVQLHAPSWHKNQKPRLRVVRSWGDPGVSVGETVQWTTDTGNGYREQNFTATVLGYRAPGGEVAGDLPNKALPYYHMK